MSDILDYLCVGLISGSSLDGLDLALTSFSIQPNQKNPIVAWRLVRAKTIAFPNELVLKLQNLPKGSALEMVKMDDSLGEYIAQCVLDFIDQEQVDLISSHGHTIFHHPGRSSTQIGNPAIIAAKTGLDTVAHLRNMDTAFGGQGAPLAPLADLYLFPEYDVCVNLGGIANISIKQGENIIGFDVCGANQFLNLLSGEMGMAYDKDGDLARSGQIESKLLESLNDLPYCKQTYPKSLDNEEVRSMYLPFFEQSNASVENQLCTMVEHIALQLAAVIPNNAKHIMIAGGGAHNSFLIERIRAAVSGNVVIPEQKIIDFKEAILIAMCGVLRINNLPNCLKSITGASKNTINGVVFKALTDSTNF